MLDNLKKTRKENNFTQGQIANLLGISRASYNRYENGDRQPSSDHLKKLSDLFNVSIDYLLDSKFPVNITNDNNTMTMPIQIFHLSSYDKNIDDSEYPVEFFHVPNQWIKCNADNYFLSYAVDDSMINAHIIDGSLLLFKRKSYLENDQIGAFSLNGKEYIRIYKKLNSGTILLQSANSNYDAIEINEYDDFKIIGILKKVITSY